MTETHLEFYRRWGALARPYFEWQFRQFAPHLGPRVADVGCGLGNFVPFLLDRDLYLGFETDPELRQEFHSAHTGSNIRLAACGDITRPDAVEEMRRERIDSVICVNVLEHIEDHRAALTNMVEGTSAGGAICLLVPAFQWLYGTLDALDGHFRRYSRPQLRELTAGLPVHIVAAYYMNLVGTAGWFLKGRILKQKAQADADYRAMNRILPVVSRLESWVKPPFGMSLVMILRKSQ